MPKPYELFAKFSSQCTRCRKRISVGEKIVRAPEGGRVFCTKNDGCGPQILRAAGVADLTGAAFFPARRNPFAS